MKYARLIFISLLLANSALAWDRTEALLARAWPAGPYAGIEHIGTGVGIVFSPDLSVSGNCSFYRALGFACFESADWLQILGDIHSWNMEHPGNRIRTLILETHGTNGHGLRVQKGKKPDDDRSYISVGALQEWVEPVGVRHIIISACNSGRLLRPEIYLKLNREPGDPLFLPATLGVIDATDSFDPSRTKVTVITPASSHIENTLVGSLRELSPPARKAVTAAAKDRGVKLPKQFAISEMLIMMMLRDPELQLHASDYTEELSKEQTSPEVSERIFKSFAAHLDTIAGRDGAVQRASTTASK
ncbi:MAG TPA: hypothetical protein VKB93_23170 [Thermoanaerobaculia bacterium]|nr:hypothetical protein [Thermoanaerobaculia bacterium]